MKYGLALGGGGLRGFAHLGAIKFLEEKGFKADIISGTSIGAMIGAMVCKGYKSHEIFEMAKGLTGIKNLIDLRLPIKGISSKDKIKKNMQNYLKGNIEDLPIKFIAAATDIEKGLPVYIEKGSIINAISASISVPGIFEPEKIGKRLLIDGGITNIVPASILKEKGAKKIISISLQHFEKSKLQKKMIINEISKNSLWALMDSLARRDEECADVKMHIPTAKYSPFSAAEPKEIYDLGYKIAKKYEKEIRDLLK